MIYPHRTLTGPPSTARCSCPALNSLANHGFLPRSGRGVTMLDIMVACFRGFGVSPETSALITADGLGEAKLPLNTTLALADVQRADFGIEHDVSFSRPDRGRGDLAALKRCGDVSPHCVGAAERRRHPAAAYDKDAAAYGALEAGMLLGVYDPHAMGADRALFCIFNLFQHEFIPAACTPSRVRALFDTVVGYATQSILENPELQKTSEGRVLTREVRSWPPGLSPLYVVLLVRVRKR